MTTTFTIREPIANPAYALPERPTRALRHLPGPRARWLDGCSAEFIRDNAGTISRLAREFGSVFKLPSLFGGGSVVMLGADANRLVLGNADENFSSHGGYMSFPIFGKAMVTRDFEDHRELRKLMGRSFTVQSLRGYFEEINDLTAKAMESLAEADHASVEIYPRAKDLALKIAARVFVGLDLGGDQIRMNEALQAALNLGSARVPLRIPGTIYHRAWKGLDYARSYFASRVASRRESEVEDQVGSGVDLFSLLCRAENERGERLGEDEVADNAVGALIAGHDTSTITIAALAYELARSPEWQDRLRSDCIKALAGSSSSTGSLDFDRAGELDSVECCVKEVLRLYAPIRYIGRRSIRAFEFKGHEIPANAAILLSVHHTHCDEREFHRASEFLPERFVPGSSLSDFDPFAWAPFGKGAHTCLGMGFTMLEIKSFFSALLSRYRLLVPGGYQMRLDGLPVSKPTDGVPLVLTPL